MLKQNVIEEVQYLLTSAASGGVMKAIGVKELTDFIEQKCDLPTAFDRIFLATCHYAKRQITWFRHQMPEEAQVIKEVGLKNVITK